jgi:hypothetical protein
LTSRIADGGRIRLECGGTAARVIDLSHEACEPPCLPAYPHSAREVRVWCCWCHRWHIHGSEVLGHRHAHCADDVDSPYKATGYVLTDPAELERRLPQQLGRAS